MSLEIAPHRIPTQSATAPGRVQDVGFAERPARQSGASSFRGFKKVRIGNELDCRPERARLVGFLVDESDEVQPFAGFGRAAELRLRTENSGDEVAFPIATADFTRHELAAKDRR